LRPEISEFEQPADLPARALGNDERVRYGQRLQPGGKVWRFADHPALLSRSRADQVADHDQPAGDTEPHIQPFWRRKPAHRLDDGEAGPHRPLGVVLMCLWI